MLLGNGREIESTCKNMQANKRHNLMCFSLIFDMALISISLISSKETAHPNV